MLAGRKAVLAVLVAVLWQWPVGCASSSRDGIQSHDPAVRVRAIIQASSWSDRKATPLIVDRLDDEDPAVRTIAAMALRRLAGQDFGYRPFDPPHRRAEAVGRWRDWLDSGGKTVTTTRPVSEAPDQGPSSCP